MDRNYRNEGNNGAFYQNKRKRAEGESSRGEDKDSGISSIVANHYNSINNKDVSERSKSKIYYMRNFNNWIKSIIIRKSKAGVDCFLYLTNLLYYKKICFC